MKRIVPILLSVILLFSVTVANAANTDLKQFGETESLLRSSIDKYSNLLQSTNTKSEKKVYAETLYNLLMSHIYLDLAYMNATDNSAYESMLFIWDTYITMLNTTYNYYQKGTYSINTFSDELIKQLKICNLLDWDEIRKEN